MRALISLLLVLGLLLAALVFFSVNTDQPSINEVGSQVDQGSEDVDNNIGKYFDTRTNDSSIVSPTAGGKKCNLSGVMVDEGTAIGGSVCISKN
jgi:hypothetical protein